MDARLQGMYAYRDVGGRPRLEQEVEAIDRVWNTSGRGGRRCRGQAVEAARSRPAKAGIQWFRPFIPAWRE